MLVDVSGNQGRRHFWSVLAILITFCGSVSAWAQCAEPQAIALHLSQGLPPLAKKKAYTQGLTYVSASSKRHPGYLFESVGLRGRSELRRIDINASNDDLHVPLEGKYAAAGTAVLDKTIYQLTAQEQTVFTYEGLEARDRDSFSIGGDAAGLAVRDGMLVMSNGSSTLSFLNATSPHAIAGYLPVYKEGRPQDRLGELESVGNYILANISYGKKGEREDIHKIAFINPRSGCVEKMLDLSELIAHATADKSEAVCETPGHCKDSDFAAAGIAHDPNSKVLYLTGKNWGYIYRFLSTVF